MTNNVALLVIVVLLGLTKLLVMLLNIQKQQENMRITAIVFILGIHAFLVQSQPINLKATTTIHVSYPNIGSPLSVVAQIYQVFPAYDFAEMGDTLSTRHYQAWLQCPLRVSQDGYLTLGKDKIKLYLVPGDTVHIQLTDYSNKLNYSFSGSTKLEQAYYLEKRK